MRARKKGMEDSRLPMARKTKANFYLAWCTEKGGSCVWMVVR